MNSNENSIAILGGTGDLGYGLSLRWAKSGREVVIGSRVGEKAEEAAEKVRTRVSGGSGGVPARVSGATNEEAVKRADIVVLAVPFPAQVATINSVKKELRAGQILVDCTVPLEATVGGAPTRILGLWEGSAAEQAARYVPEGVRVVAAFHNVPAHGLQEIETKVDCDVVVCGDEAAAREKLREWVELIPDLRYVDGGKLENARIVESITALIVGINRRYKVPGAGIRFTGLEARGGAPDKSDKGNTRK
jgi:NADPH-dependent F420 reductase